MNLKKLALLVFMAQAGQFALSLYNAIGRGYMSGLYLLQVGLTIPLMIFFFYIWKRQKT